MKASDAVFWVAARDFDTNYHNSLVFGMYSSTMVTYIHEFLVCVCVCMCTSRYHGSLNQIP